MRPLLLAFAAPLLFAADLVKESDPKSLTAIVSFLASDSLQGRDTPSAGLDISADYIASEFRRAGLDPLSDGGYFQTATFTVRRLNKEGFSLSFADGEKNVLFPASTTFWNAKPAVSLSGAAVRKISVTALEQLTDKIAEPVVLLSADNPGPAIQRAISRLGADGVKLVVLVGIPVPLPSRSLEFSDQPSSPTVFLRTTDASADSWLKALPEGPVAAKANANIPAAFSEEHTAKNVIGVLPGQTRDEAIILSAHYDHLGVNPNDPTDKVFNGANDNASGVASVIESARLLKQLGVTPKRTIFFVAWFGEERGLLGSRYFARHPVLPLKNVVANLNLEQTGRTDSSDGQANLNQANLTGYHFTTIHQHLEEAAKELGFNFVKHERFSDPFFQASDNFAFSAAGVPSTTLSVTYQFPDYHQKGDEWPKIDYANMAKVTRAIAQGILRLATAETKVTWNESEPKTKIFRDAAAKLSGTN
jgi:hypothetical protein